MKQESGLISPHQPVRPPEAVEMYTDQKTTKERFVDWGDVQNAFLDE